MSQTECGFMWLLAAMVAMWHWNVSQYVTAVIRQSKQTAQTRGERPGKQQKKIENQGEGNGDRVRVKQRRTEDDGK